MLWDRGEFDHIVREFAGLKPATSPAKMRWSAHTHWWQESRRRSSSPSRPWPECRMTTLSLAAAQQEAPVRRVS